MDIFNTPTPGKHLHTIHQLLHAGMGTYFESLLCVARNITADCFEVKLTAARNLVIGDADYVMEMNSNDACSKTLQPLILVHKPQGI